MTIEADYMKDRVKCLAVGVSSLLLDGTEGTKDERHVVYVDLDSTDLEKRPNEFRSEVLRVMFSIGLSDLYVFRTLKGFHLFSPNVLPRRIAERVEERLEPWGGDGFHRFMGYVNGETVLRASAKPGEGSGPRYVKNFRTTLRAPWSGAHYDFFNDLHGGRLPRPFGTERVESKGIRLHHYETTASTKAAPLEEQTIAAK